MDHDQAATLLGAYALDLQIHPDFPQPHIAVVKDISDLDDDHADLVATICSEATRDPDRDLERLSGPGSALHRPRL